MSDFLNGRDGRRDDECRGDLLARERRGELSGADCLALRTHLAECSSCRLARRVFVDLDDVSGVDLRDGLRIERMSSAARRWTHQRSRPIGRLWKGRRRLRALGLAASVLLIGGTASAAVWLWNNPAAFRLYSILSGDFLPGVQTFGPGWRSGGRHGDASARPSTVLSGSMPDESEESKVWKVAPPRLGESAVAWSLVDRADPAAARAPGHAIRSTPRRLSRIGSTEGSTTPASLLREASDSRRQGDAERAIRAYRKLQQEFPDSSEALVSSVAIGGLLLDKKAPRSALAQFDAYLGSSRGSGLTPEALYGRGRALAALGERQEERRSWERLLGDFPDSAYAPLARRRLADLK